jgi:hypothetical protein
MHKCENRNVVVTYKSFHDDQDGFRFNIYSQQSETFGLASWFFRAVDSMISFVPTSSPFI